jgi:amidase
VVCPASVNGVVGIRPNMGLVSRTGIVPISHTQDSAGPMTRNVADAAILLAAMIGSDPLDPATQHGQAALELGDVGGLGAAGVRGRRIGVLRSALGYHEGVEALLRRAIAALQAAGAEIVDDLELTPYDGFDDDSYDVLLYEFKHDLDAYLAGLPNALNTLTLEKLIRFNEQHAEAEMAYFQQEVFLKAQAKGPLTDEAYTGALARIRQATRQDGIDRLLREHRLDALIAPTCGPAWTIDLVNGDNWGVQDFSTYPAVAGYPHVTLPMGDVHGLPVGLSFTGAAFSERALIDMASVFERLMNSRGD